MFIELQVSAGFFALGERNRRLDAFVYRYIALRWSANQWSGPESINIWLLWSQNEQV
jgi:hypothetical protein